MPDIGEKIKKIVISHEVVTNGMNINIFHEGEDFTEEDAKSIKDEFGSYINQFGFEIEVK